MDKLVLTAEQKYNRLDAFLADNSEFTRSRMQKLIADGMVVVDGVVVNKSSVAVKCGAQVVVNLPDSIPMDIVPQDIPIDIVYEDEHIAVINKQQGLTVHPASGQYTDTLVNALLYRLKNLSGINGVLRPGIVHRLDKMTSGLLVVAKDDISHVRLAEQIKDKTCRRIYLAVVEGIVKEKSGKVEQPIARSRADRKKMAIDADGRYALTYYSVVERYRNNTFMRFELKTGRTHQIRVHCKYMGHPIVGDAVYGYKNQRFKLDGQLLHAWKLQFIHPVSGKQMCFCASLPQYFESVLKTLRSGGEYEKLIELDEND